MGDSDVSGPSGDSFKTKECVSWEFGCVWDNENEMALFSIVVRRASVSVTVFFLTSIDDAFFSVL